MRRALLLVSLYCWSCSAQADDMRRFEFSYRMLAANFPAAESVDIYIPLPAEDHSQRIISRQFRSSLPGKAGFESRHGNRYYHIHRPANINNPIDAELTWVVERRRVTRTPASLATAVRDRYLAPNRLVPVGHAILDPILAEVRADRVDDTAASTARAIYDWVVDNIDYRKIGTGWGNGDTFWACSERYGNCTDFHALFIALARTEGIPARFEIGFPIPEGRTEGRIAGYHCWVKVYLAGEGWVPIDASEAVKQPEKRELFYGTHPADRIHFSTGRDLVLTAANAVQPVNYFIYPYVEVGGKPWRVNLETVFSYRELSTGQAAVY